MGQRRVTTAEQPRKRPLAARSQRSGNGDGGQHSGLAFIVGGRGVVTSATHDDSGHVTGAGMAAAQAVRVAVADETLLARLLRQHQRRSMSLVQIVVCCRQ